MSTRPYTTADLRAEAARQHANATEDPDFMGIGERMEGSRIESTVTDPDAPVTTAAGGRTWDMLARDDFESAQRAVDELLTSAADVSEWAVNLGADGLEPCGSDLEVKGGGRPIIRVHFAFDKDMPDDVRQSFVAGVGVAIAEEL